MPENPDLSHEIARHVWAFRGLEDRVSTVASNAKAIRYRARNTVASTPASVTPFEKGEAFSDFLRPLVTLRSLTSYLQMPGITFLKFLLVGIVNSCVGLAVIYACKWFLGFNDVVANMSGYAVGLTVSFVLNSRWTFRYRGSVWSAVTRFLMVFLVAYSVNLFIVLLLIDSFGVNSYLSQAIGVPFYTLVLYSGSRWLAFREPVKSDASSPEVG